MCVFSRRPSPTRPHAIRLLQKHYRWVSLIWQPPCSQHSMLPLLTRCPVEDTVRRPLPPGKRSPRGAGPSTGSLPFAERKPRLWGGYKTFLLVVPRSEELGDRRYRRPLPHTPKNVPARKKNSHNPKGRNALRYVKTSPCWRCRGVSLVTRFLHENDFITNVWFLSHAVEQSSRRTSGGRQDWSRSGGGGGGGGTGRRNGLVPVGGTGRLNHIVAVGQHHDLRLFRNRERH